LVEKNAVGAFQWIFCFRGQGDHLKTWFRNTKNMIHYYDVIKKHVNEDTQKTFARSQCQTVQKMSIPIIILTSLWTKAEFICIHFHRTLSEGQEIYIRSFFFHKVWFEKLWLEFFYLRLLSLNIEFLRVYFLLWCLSVYKSRDSVKKIFRSLTVIMLKRKIGDKLSKLYLKLMHFLHWFEKYLFRDQQIFEPEVLIKFLK